jgi:hypothetical protein
LKEKLIRGRIHAIQRCEKLLEMIEEKTANQGVIEAEFDDEAEKLILTREVLAIINETGRGDNETIRAHNRLRIIFDDSFGTPQTQG